MPKRRGQSIQTPSVPTINETDHEDGNAPQRLSHPAVHSNEEVIDVIASKIRWPKPHYIHRIDVGVDCIVHKKDGCWQCKNEYSTYLVRTVLSQNLTDLAKFGARWVYGPDQWNVEYIVPSSLDAIKDHVAQFDILRSDLDHLVLYICGPELARLRSVIASDPPGNVGKPGSGSGWDTFRDSQQLQHDLLIAIVAAIQYRLEKHVRPRQQMLLTRLNSRLAASGDPLVRIRPGEFTRRRATGQSQSRPLYEESDSDSDSESESDSESASESASDSGSESDSDSSSEDGDTNTESRPEQSTQTRPTAITKLTYSFDQDECVNSPILPDFESFNDLSTSCILTRPPNPSSSSTSSRPRQSRSSISRPSGPPERVGSGLTSSETEIQIMILDIVDQRLSHELRAILNSNLDFAFTNVQSMFKTKSRELIKRQNTLTRLANAGQKPSDSRSITETTRSRITTDLTGMLACIPIETAKAVVRCVSADAFEKAYLNVVAAVHPAFQHVDIVRARVWKRVIERNTKINDPSWIAGRAADISKHIEQYCASL